MIKPKYCYDDNPDETRPYMHIEHRTQYGTAKITQLPKYKYLDVNDELDGAAEKTNQNSYFDAADEQVLPETSTATYSYLNPESYDKSRGVLHLSSAKKVPISKRGSARKKDGTRYFECWLLECVFKTVNTQKTGVTFSKILSVNSKKIEATEIRKLRNAVDAINKKVTEAKGPKKLIIIQGTKVFVNNSYL